MKQLFLDVETFSSVDLRKAGAFRYFASPDFAIMLCSYKWVHDGVPGPTMDVDLLSGEELPDSVYLALFDPAVEKHAHNALFEIGAFGAHYGVELDIRQWKCDMVHAQYAGLPAQLGDLCKVLKTKHQKDFRGSSLIRVFCGPCKPTKKNAGRTRNLPHHDPDRWSLFKWYCHMDVESEYEVHTRLEKLPVPEVEWENWYLDSRMNAHGVKVDLQLIEQAIKADEANKEKLTARAVKLTGLSNPNSVSQLKKWISAEFADGEEIERLNKTSIPLLDNMAFARGLDGVNELLALRQRLGKTSISKYSAMLRAADEQGYIRGLIQFYGANRTGRAAGRLVQVQNLKKNSMDQLLYARELIRSGDFELVELLWGDLGEVLSQLVRTAIIPDDGCLFAPVDFSAIEARWLAWAADETWRLEVFRTHGRIYEASAAAMFNVPLESITKGSPLRQKGKVSELACGYQGGEGALVRMGALDMGLKQEELKPIIDAWRAANLGIAGRSYKGQAPGLWERMETAAINTVATRKAHEVGKGIAFRYHAGCLLMRLPGGRELCYCKPSLKDGDYGPQLWYWGQDQTTKQWQEIPTYGGKLVENGDQGNCRDLLYHKLRRMEAEELHHYVRFTVHDEVVPSIPIALAEDVKKRIEDLFAEEVPWAPGLPLRGDGSLLPVYMKDD